MAEVFENGATTGTPFGKVNYTYTSDQSGPLLLTINHREASMDKLAGNAANKANAGHPGKPARWKLRHVHASVVDTGKLYNRTVAVCDPQDALFTGLVSDFTLDGLLFQCHGRIGEKRSS